MDDITRVARDHFGLPHLRPDQRRAIDAAIAGDDVLVVWATGSGKSAVYQIAAALRPGLAAVVSPLIALQEDQLARLEAAPDAPTGVAVNSSRGVAAQRRAWERIEAGEVEYVLLAPEQLAKEEVVDRLVAAGVSLLVVDEAHCIAAWGHDFRPDYLLLGEVAERLGRPPVLALTATASTPVREEIVTRLQMRDPVVLTGDVDRPNIALTVRRHPKDADKRAAVLEDVAGLPGPGLLYAATRRGAEDYAEALAERGLRAVPYHAGLPAAEREDVHERFSAGDLDVVVATSAFGMGIDKADVRFVVHADAPDSVDAYYQELGRAGRDGAPAQAILHYRPEDLALRRYFATAQGCRGTASSRPCALRRPAQPRRARGGHRRCSAARHGAARPSRGRRRRAHPARGGHAPAGAGRGGGGDGGARARRGARAHRSFAHRDAARLRRDPAMPTARAAGVLRPRSWRSPAATATRAPPDRPSRSTGPRRRSLPPEIRRSRWMTG